MNDLLGQKAPSHQWLIAEEPHLVHEIYKHFIDPNAEISFDSGENSERLSRVSEHLLENIEEIYQNFTQHEKMVLNFMHNSFGWIAYGDSMLSTVQIFAKVFKTDPDQMTQAVQNLLKNFFVLNLERLKKYNLLFTPPFFLSAIKERLEAEDFGLEDDVPEDFDETCDSISASQYISLIAGLISYVITISPRSSESNEIHKIDFTKMVDYFSDFAGRDEIEKAIKKLSRFGFFEKLNNRIVINKNLMDKILELSVSEQLFVIFLYEFMDKFDFKKNYFMTLKILAKMERPITLRRLFLHHLNNKLYLTNKLEAKNLRNFLQQQELKFSYFMKSLEAENIVSIFSKIPGKVNIGSDSIVLNEPHACLLKNVALRNQFVEEKFVVEANYEIIVEPFLKPEILFKLALICEPVTIQTISIFRITRESIYRSFAYGITPQEILPFLTEHSKHELPENVSQGILTFIQSLEVEDMLQHNLIQVSSHDSYKINEHFKNKVIEIEPHTFLIFDSDVYTKILSFCEEEGLKVKKVENFLDGENYFYRQHETELDHNIKHLHSMREFFDFYGSFLEGTKVKIDNKI